jgi:hypothetical protein
VHAEMSPNLQVQISDSSNLVWSMKPGTYGYQADKQYIIPYQLNILGKMDSVYRSDSKNKLHF